MFSVWYSCVDIFRRLNLFTNIQVKDVISLIEKDLLDSGSSLAHNIEMGNLLKVCLEQNFFTFNKIIFTQIEGIAMGSPLSPLLALFMHNLESEKIVTGNQYSQQIQFYSSLVVYRWDSHSTARKLRIVTAFFNTLKIYILH